MKRIRIAPRRGRAPVALRLALLALPVVFWSAVFAVLAGVRPVQRIVAATPDSAQVIVALACPLVAVLLGAAALRCEGRAGAGRGGGEARLGRLTVAAGMVLFAFAVLASLGPA
ncbi:MAG TPA: hypothetical protein VF240_05180 [Pyrinomonadaceae bacterium]